MDELEKAIGSIIKAVAMGLECLLWGGVDLAKKVVNRWYIGAVITLGFITIVIPSIILRAGLVGMNWSIAPPLAGIGITLMVLSLISAFRSKGLTTGRVAGFIIGVALATNILAGGPVTIALVAGRDTILLAIATFVILACVWWVAAVPATLLIGAGIDVAAFVKVRMPGLKPYPANPPAKKK